MFNTGRRKIVKGCLFIALLSVMVPSVLAAKEVNINKANAIDIAESLDGIGEKRAQAIVKYRMQHGPFTSLKQISEVAGVGERTLEKNAKYIQMK